MQTWNEDKVIPFDAVIGAIRRLPYGSSHRVILTIRFLTGCRGSEINNMKKSLLFGNVLYFDKGKNQKGKRKEYLPDKFIEELKYYWKHNATKSDQFFSISAETFRTQFDKFIRKKLDGKWLEKKVSPVHSFCREEFIYQLNFLRKDFWTLDYSNNIKKYKSLEVALYMTQKRAGHHSAYMTCAHYIQNFEALQISKYQGKTINEIYEKEIICQLPLLAWM